MNPVYKLITGPTELAVSLANAKKQLNIELAFTDDDTFITNSIHAAAQFVEKIIQGPVMSQTWELQLYDFESIFEIKKGPVSSVTSLRYYNTSNVDTAINNTDNVAWWEDLASTPARIIMNDSYTIPSVYDSRFDAVRLRVVCGYANEAAVPYDLRQWINVLITQFYESRDFNVKPDTMALIQKNLMAHAAWL